MDNTENVLNAGVVVDGNLSGCVSCISELGDTVLGQFCLGFPFIWMKTTNSIKKILTDSICKRISTDEQEDCFVFTHELIHAIQAVCFPVAQIPFARALMRVYDIRHTAEERIKAKTVVFDPLIVSGYSDDVARIERERSLETRFGFGLMTDRYISLRQGTSWRVVRGCWKRLIEERQHEMINRHTRRYSS